VLDRLDCKVVIVTGGTAGIGRGVAFGFDKRGANVLVASTGQTEQQSNSLYEYFWILICPTALGSFQE